MQLNIVNFIECKVNLISRLTNQYNLNVMTHKSFTTKFSIFACLEIFVCFIRQQPLRSSAAAKQKAYEIFPWQ